MAMKTNFQSDWVSE